MPKKLKIYIPIEMQEVYQDYFSGNFFARRKQLHALFLDWGLPLPARRQTALRLAVRLMKEERKRGARRADIVRALPGYLSTFDLYCLAVGALSALVTLTCLYS